MGDLLYRPRALHVAGDGVGKVFRSIDSPPEKSVADKDERELGNRLLGRPAVVASGAPDDAHGDAGSLQQDPVASHVQMLLPGDDVLAPGMTRVADLSAKTFKTEPTETENVSVTWQR
jgi:hypothetical protein